jgi:hypothetical protein
MSIPQELKDVENALVVYVLDNYPESFVTIDWNIRDGLQDGSKSVKITQRAIVSLDADEVKEALKGL